MKQQWAWSRKDLDFNPEAFTYQICDSVQKS